MSLLQRHDAKQTVTYMMDGYRIVRPSSAQRNRCSYVADGSILLSTRL